MSDWHDAYRRRYAEAKKAGKAFFPFAVFKDAAMILIIFGALCAVAYFAGAKLDDLADPTDTTYNPRPEWYFLALFQALKFFPGKLEAVAAVIVPGLAVLVLFLTPLLDRGPKRHPLDRPWFTGFGIAGIVVVAYLTWTGYKSPLTNPAMEKNPPAMRGKRLFRELKCFYCHSIHGQGGVIGPDLAKVAGAESDDWLIRHFRDPQAVTPGSQMPKMNLLDDEIMDLIAYLKTLGQATERYSPEAPRLFSENCAVCHRMGREGGDIGPDLSTIGSIQDKHFFERYIADSGSLNPHSQMPKFRGQLTDLEIEDLARYLAAHP
ncbi:MAG TPA: c-type cytochrome [Elusimicrobiota bacterium]|nr:c-type cytochrome [Elusimicrobiota bacterium]